MGSTPVALLCLMTTAASLSAARPIPALPPVAGPEVQVPCEGMGGGSACWQARFDGGAAASDAPVRMAVNPLGSRVFVTGTAANPWYNQDVATLAYDAFTGATAWEARFDGPTNSDRASDLAIRPDGGLVFVAGGTAGFGTGVISSPSPTMPRPASSVGSPATTPPTTAPRKRRPSR